QAVVISGHYLGDPASDNLLRPVGLTVCSVSQLANLVLSRSPQAPVALEKKTMVRSGAGSNARYGLRLDNVHQQKRRAEHAISIQDLHSNHFFGGRMRPHCRHDTV